MTDRKNSAESGEATVEFVALTALLVLPLIYLIFALAQLHATVLAAEATAQAVANLHSLGASATQIEDQKALIVRDYHLSAPLQTRVDCGQCRRGSILSVTVTGVATLPGMERFAGLETAGVPVETTVQTIVLKERP